MPVQIHSMNSLSESPEAVLPRSVGPVYDTVCRSGDGWSEAATRCVGKQYAHKLSLAESPKPCPICFAAFVVIVLVEAQHAALSGKALV